MRDLDKMIEDALGDEESEVLRRIGGDAGFIERAMNMFGAGLEWTVRFMLFGQTVIFIAGVWATWKFFEAGDPVEQLRWGPAGSRAAARRNDGQDGGRPRGVSQSHDARAQEDRTADCSCGRGSEQMMAFQLAPVRRVSRAA